MQGPDGVKKDCGIVPGGSRRRRLLSGCSEAVSNLGWAYWWTALKGEYVMATLNVGAFGRRDAFGAIGSCSKELCAQLPWQVMQAWRSYGDGTC